MPRLVVVSNRVTPPKRSRSGAEGGLAVALRAALEDQGGLWFGWSGGIRRFDEPGRHIVEDNGVTYATIDLTHRDHEEYYMGFANRVLWPLLHYRLDLMEFTRRALAGYTRVNRLFAKSLSGMLEPDDIIWVHDYHLFPLGEALRQLGHRNRIGFFLHVPWPAPEVLRTLPMHRNLVRALASYDLVGLQTESDAREFRANIEREPDGKVHADGSVTAFGRHVIVDSFPISIDAEEMQALAVEAEASRQTRRLRESLRRRKLVIGVDRLDYTKGLPERFEAFAHLLAMDERNRSEVVMLQIAPPSRSEVPEYQTISQRLDSIAGHINSRYAEFDWVPIRYINRGFARRTLAGFHRISKVGFVTPLRDGMNLVAKEYVAAQDPSDPGVLVLSQFAGAAQELDAALMVNPYDAEGMAAALQTALTMRLGERRERWSAMMERLKHHDIDFWRKRFLTALERTEGDPGAPTARSTEMLGA